MEGTHARAVALAFPRGCVECRADVATCLSVLPAELDGACWPGTAVGLLVFSWGRQCAGCGGWMQSVLVGVQVERLLFLLEREARFLQ